MGRVSDQAEVAERPGWKELCVRVWKASVAEPAALGAGKPCLVHEVRDAGWIPKSQGKDWRLLNLDRA